MWLDGVVSPQLLASMKPYQRVNHFPGMYGIARKSNLCMNLNKIRKHLPDHYDFYPLTWFLPSEYIDFENYFNSHGGIYVLVTGCDPLRIFIHKEGLARFATEKYKKPGPTNIEEVCMHLTNYSLNKHNPKFIKNINANEDNIGHKRSLRSTIKLLKNRGYDTDKM